MATDDPRGVTPSFLSYARQTPGVEIVPAAVYVDTAGQMVPSNKVPTGQVTALQVGSRGEVNLFIPMTFNLRIPNSPFQTAPLTLFVTPGEIQVTRKKALAEHVTRQGTIREEWGDELDTWSCSGQVAAFYSQQFGLTQVLRSQSVGYKNFLSLLSFYKNNGRSYYTRGKAATPGKQSREKSMEIRKDRAYSNREDLSPRSPSLDTYLKSRPRNSSLNKPVLWNPSRIIQHVGHVEIVYDFRLLRGHFESFEWDDDVEHPHNINYSFTFVVTGQYDLVAELSGTGTVRA